LGERLFADLPGFPANASAVDLSVAQEHVSRIICPGDFRVEFGMRGGG